jgi:hypothetical protein
LSTNQGTTKIYVQNNQEDVKQIFELTWINIIKYCVMYAMCIPSIWSEFDLRFLVMYSKGEKEKK